MVLRPILPLYHRRLPSAMTPSRARHRAEEAGAWVPPFPPEHPREVRTHEPPAAPRVCERCGKEKVKLGEKCSETLEFVAASFKVIREESPKLGCRP
ncbi:IS66 family transposase zinc-finger binding domain-containing protein [Vulgatibacter incomptus]|uniref:IS66 family transposase zinc-finger binding domain-containing protein n=1 Tax=Vulgatibacter incomptus TaxID=1391653 RepID=UPI0009EB7F91